jgi:thioredoxin 1
MRLVVNQVTFNQEVLNSPIPVLVNFWAPWCGICHLVNPMVADLQTQWSGDLKVVNVNADENLILASTHRLTSLPTLVLFDRGTILHRAEQFTSRNDFRHALADFHTALRTAHVYSYSA